MTEASPIKDAINFVHQNVRDHGWAATHALREAAAKFSVNVLDLVKAWNDREVDWQREADYLAELANARAARIRTMEVQLAIATEALRFCADEYGDDLAIAAVTELDKHRNKNGAE